MKVRKEAFGFTTNGKKVWRFLLENGRGTKVGILTYGGIIQTFLFGGLDIVLGFDTVEDYEKQDAYIGAILGRFANRIGGGKFVLNDKEYELYVNNGPNHLHGGREGFDRKIWRGEVVDEGLKLSYTSPDGEEGYPGRLETQVTYFLDEADGLCITYHAESNEDTVVNLSNHSYFNLSGHEMGHLVGHRVQIFGDKFLENDEDGLPTGVLRQVTGTPMDFTQPRMLVLDVDGNYDQLKLAKGYDHNWVINGEGMRQFAIAESLATGIQMTVTSDQPGMQVYTANFLELTQPGKGGMVYPRWAAICFETQGYPNATAFPSFPSPILRKGQVYQRETIYRLEKK